MTTAGKYLLIAFACAGLSGCASIGPPLPPSLELPKPPVDLHAARKGDRVTLTWTVPARTTDRRSVRYLDGTQICRGLETVLKQCGQPLGVVASATNLKTAKKPEAKLTASYVDTLPTAIERENPTGFATYAIDALNTAGRGAGLSNQVHVPLVPTLPPFDDFAGKVTAQGIQLTWRCPKKPQAASAGVDYRFRVYRRGLSGEAETKIAEIAANQCATGLEASTGEREALPDNIPVTAQDSFLDRTFEWEKTYLYRATVVSVEAVPERPPVQVEGEDTPQVQVFANDVFPPAVPTGLQAVFSGPGQQPFIDLIWTPDTDADLAGYNVYRRTAEGAQEKLNAELVRSPSFRDSKIAPGETCFYTVSAVDMHSNESAHSEEASETVPRNGGVVPPQR